MSINSHQYNNIINELNVNLKDHRLFVLINTLKPNLVH